MSKKIELGVPLTEGTVWLMNSAMMPVPGRYEYFDLTPDEFAACVKQAHADGSLVSCIGYPHNAGIIKDMTGIEVEVTRITIRPEPGDVMLVMPLKRRVAEPWLKGKLKPPIDAFRFGLVKYYGEREEEGDE